MANFERAQQSFRDDEQRLRSLGGATILGTETSGFPFLDRQVAEHLEAEAARVPFKDRVEEARIAIAGGEEAMAEYLLGK
ncbi:MAG: hypothetical protein JWO96_334 [Candidatus Saccharibacteria bacterium]|nr:hypothetical protein [Candidatus Saccharibacteria bacterium]